MDMFPTIDEFTEMLCEITDKVPEEFFNQLNMGIVVSKRKKISPKAINGDLLVLGEYCVSNLGRGITIYYGSCRAKFMYEDIDLEQLKCELEEILFHEFTHHIESLAGEKGLEIKDYIQLQEYLNRKRG